MGQQGDSVRVEDLKIYHKTIEVHAEYWEGPGNKTFHWGRGFAAVAGPGSYIVWDEVDFPIVLSKDAFERMYEEVTGE